MSFYAPEVELNHLYLSIVFELYFWGTKRVRPCGGME